MFQEYPLVTNAAGEGSKTVEQIERLLNFNPYRSAVIGSITLEKREGNPEPNFYYLEDLKTSINSIGLKNPGMEYYTKNLPRILEENPEGFLILSIAWAPAEKGYKNIKAEELNEDPSLQFEILTQELVKIDRERILIELNLSCPSINDSLLYEDLESVGRILEKVEKKTKRYTIKLGYMLPNHLNKMVSLVSSYNPFGIVAINSIPGMFVDENGKSYIAKKYGGVAGKLIQPFALYTVSKLREKLDEEERKDIKIIGCGGISNAKDGLKFLRNGADYLQVGTAFMIREVNRKFFSRFVINLLSLLEEN